MCSLTRSFKNIEKERGALHERTGRLVLENKALVEELGKSREEIEALRSESRQMVSGQAVAQLEEQYEQKIRETEQLEQRLAARDSEAQAQTAELLREKKELLEKALLLENSVGNLERELSLRDTQLGSLEKLMATREGELHGAQQTSKSMSFEKQGLVARVGELEQEREKLIKDNVFLISQNELFSKKIEEQKQAETRLEARGEAQLSEYVELVQFYNEKATKYEEIARLQETNMKVGKLGRLADPLLSPPPHSLLLSY